MKNFLKNIKLLSVKEYAEDPAFQKRGEVVNKQTVLKQIWEGRLPENVSAQKVGKQYVMIIFTPPEPKKS